jgi:DNA-binding GntR family transcriptional regulator
MSPPPLYERVESILAASIADGSLPPETQLPAEERLIEQFKVSRTTVRKAIQNLIERGLVEVRRGKGTFVTQPKITQELTELTGFVEDIQALGRHPTARLLDKRIVAADEAVAHHLALAPGTLVVRLRRVRLADGVAMSFDETYLPRDIGRRSRTTTLSVARQSKSCVSRQSTSHWEVWIRGVVASLIDCAHTEIARKAWPIWPPPPAAAGLTVDLSGEFALP